jgi:hypothetical protein
MTVVRKMNRDINVRDIDNMSDLSFYKAIGTWGGSFLVYYINNAEPNEEYVRRLSMINLVSEDIILSHKELEVFHHRSKDILPDGFSILDALSVFKNMDKIKVIDSIEDVSFLNNFNFPIKVDLIVKEDIPKYLEYLFTEKKNELLEDLFLETIVKEISNNEKIYQFAFEIFEFYDYNMNSFNLQENPGYFDLENKYKNKGLKITKKEAEEIDFDGVVVLEELSKPYMKDIVGWYIHVLEEVEDLKIINKYKFLGGDIDGLTNKLYRAIVDNLIYFHEEGNISFYDGYTDESLSIHIGVSPIFYYEKDEGFENKSDLIDAIMGYVS